MEGNPTDPVPGVAAPIGVLGKYQLLERIGEGGFGTVYRGFDPLIKRTVAIKTCEAKSEEIRARFFREAELAGKLKHPNITTLYDFAIEEDTPFIVQEFLPGEDLDRLIARREPSMLAQKLDILIAVARALEYAHGAGVIHRDVKPANVRVLPDGSAKIMDFGIAKSIDGGPHLTRSGVTVGSSSYMSPEQIRGEELDCRTDLFSLGVLAYEFVAGQKPFHDESLAALLDQIVREEPVPVAEAASDIPPSLAGIIEGLLRKSREERPGSASEVAAALEAVACELHPPGDNSAPSSDPVLPRDTLESPRLSKLLLGVAALALLLPHRPVRSPDASKQRGPELSDPRLRRWTSLHP